MGIKNVELLIKHEDSTNNNQQKDNKNMEPTNHGVTQTGEGDGLVTHESGVRDTVDSELKDLSSQGVIADVAARGTTHSTIADAASPGASYVQAEVVALRTEIVALNADRVDAEVTIDSLRTKLNLVLGVLRDAGLIPRT